MVTVPLPKPGAQPQHWSAVKLLSAAGLKPRTVVKIYSPGDPAAELDAQGKPRETVLFVTMGGMPLTATLAKSSVLHSHPGW